MADEDPHDFDVFAAPQAEGYRLIHVDTVNGVCRITLNRPPANVLSIEMMEDINRALDSLEYQRDVKLLVLVGSGKYFSAGFELADHLGDRAYVMLESFRRIVENLAKVDKPSLAVVAGSALGAGSMLAAACDMCLAGASARFGHPEIRGAMFNPVAAVLLPRMVGRKRAFDMILRGALLTAQEAERAGLITRAVPDERLEAEVAAAIQRFQEGSAPVLQLARRAVAGGLDLPLPDAFNLAEDVYLNQLLATEDAEEGLRAVMEKRRPVWKEK
jgi:cyclohexa-1,5-dienecarbonyl-CoA hydratase